MIFNLKNMKIQHKLTAIIMLTCTVAVLAGFIVLSVQDYLKGKDRISTSFSTYATIIAENSKAAVAFNDSGDAGQILSALSSTGDVTLACLYDSKGEVLAKYQRSDIKDDIQLPEAHSQGCVFSWRNFSVFQDINLDNEKIGSIYLQVELRRIHREFLSNLLIGVVMTIGVLVFAYFLSLRLQAIVSGPIVKLSEIAKVVSDKRDYSLRARQYSDDEVGLLTVAFNKMLSQIQKRDRELVETNAQLEAKVERRTANLASTVEKLNQSNQQLQEFVYVASHDLREPVRKISSFGQLLIESLSGRLDEDEQENFNFMIDGANRMQQMIESLLTYSRITTKAAEFEDVDLGEIVKQIREFELSVKIEETKAVISVAEPLPTVKADQAQMRQLIQNLIGNALKYQKEGVTPEVAIRAVNCDDGMVRLEIEDNGIGIMEEQCENVFIMFRRLHSRQKYEGTGIGLAVCKKIVERHGGKIGVKSTYGQGSTFWFTLPRLGVQGEAVEAENREDLVLSLGT